MVTPGVERLFVDTNILVYATDEDSPWQSVAEQALEDWRGAGTRLCVSVQVLREYLAVTTRPAAGRPGDPDYVAIAENLRSFREDFLVFGDTLPVSLELESLVRQFSIQGRQVHDANIVATLRVFGLGDLLTYNTADFRRYASLITVHPLVPTTTVAGGGLTQT
jgi:predicted nucleic acid-binding protein